MLIYYRINLWEKSFLKKVFIGMQPRLKNPAMATTLGATINYSGIKN